MKLLVNILLPLGLAFVAGVLNFAVLSRTTPTHSYISVTNNMATGDQFKLPLLKQVKVAAVVPGAIPWEERNVLVTLRTPRPFEEGDWVLRSDIVPSADGGIQLREKEVALNVSLEGIVLEPKLLKIGQPIGFVIREADGSKGEVPVKSKVNDKEKKGYRVVGPFRLVTLGEFSVQEMESDERENVRPPKTISVAVPSSDGKVLDPESQMLAQAIEQTNITAIVLYPTEVKAAREKSVPKSEKKEPDGGESSKSAAGEKPASEEKSDSQ